MTIQLFHGDSLKILGQLLDESVDAIFADPPYSSGGAFRSDRMGATSTKYTVTGTQIERPEFEGDNRDQRAYLLWCGLWLGECLRIARAGAPIALFTDWRQLPTTIDALQVGGFVWRGIVPWNKTEAARPVKGRFKAQCEYVVWGSKGAMQDPAESDACMPGFFTYPVLQADKFHTTGKPTSLMIDLLKIVRPGGTILDPFMGSGTTGVAAVRMGYSFIGIELTRDYFQIAQTRINAEQSQPNMLARPVNPQASAPALF